MARPLAEDLVKEARAAPRFAVEPARPGDDAELRRLLRETPVPGAVSVSYEREPDFFAAIPAEGERATAVVMRDRDSGRIVGLGTRTVHAAYVDGVTRNVGYLGQLRLAPAFQGTGAFVRPGYAAIAAARRPDETTFDLTMLVDGNARAQRLLTANLPRMPRYRPLEPWITLAISCAGFLGKETSSGAPIERGDPGRLEEILSCLDRSARRRQFARVWTKEALGTLFRRYHLSPGDFLVTLRDGLVAGCLAIWDQRPFRQPVVRGYRAPYSAIRPVWNVFARTGLFPRLPRPGEPLELAWLSHLATDEDDPAILIPLIQAARREARRRGLPLLMLGMAERHPLLETVRRAVPCFAYRSRLYRVDHAPRTSADPVDGARIPHLEGALL